MSKSTEGIALPGIALIAGGLSAWDTLTSAALQLTFLFDLTRFALVASALSHGLGIVLALYACTASRTTVHAGWEGTTSTREPRYDSRIRGLAAALLFLLLVSSLIMVRRELVFYPSLPRAVPLELVCEPGGQPAKRKRVWFLSRAGERISIDADSDDDGRVSVVNLSKESPVLLAYVDGKGTRVTPLSRLDEENGLYRLELSCGTTDDSQARRNRGDFRIADVGQTRECDGHDGPN